MKKEELFEAIGEIDDKLIANSGKRGKKRNTAVLRTMMATAACLVLLFGATAAMKQLGVIKPLQPIGENTVVENPTATESVVESPVIEEPLPEQEDSLGLFGDGMGAGEEEQDSSYSGPSIIGGGEGGDAEIEVHYGMDPWDEFIDFEMGPLMPVTLEKENSAVVAMRDMTYDFSEVTKKSNGYVTIRDSYQLLNTSDAEQTVALLYPQIGSVAHILQYLPEVAINGEKKDAELLPGYYYGTDTQGYERVVSYCLDAENMGSVIGDVASHVSASVQNEKLLEKKVMVYEFSDITCEGEMPEYATYAMKLKLDDDKNVYFQNIDIKMYIDGYMYVGFYAETVQKGITPRIIFADGKEATECIGQGYSFNEFSEEYEVDNISVQMTKKEVAMGELLKESIDYCITELKKEGRAFGRQEELLCNMLAEQILTDVMRRNREEGEMQDLAAMFYNLLDDIAYYACMAESSFLVKHTITIPAGESAIVTYTYEKQGNHDETGAPPEYYDCYGYDNAITMGTNLHFTKQVANIKEQGNIEIIEQNYDFDLENGITSVELDLETMFYYMVVRVLKE